MPTTLSQPTGFRWRPLGELARLESGHTPSRKVDEYWDGEIPWIGIRDATANHGRTIDHTLQNVTQKGIENSSARILPAGTVCLSRTASVGYVVRMGVPMATSQDFVNWVCGPGLSSRYLRYLLVAEQESVRRFSYGTTHQTMYYPEAKALHVCVPERSEQDAIAEILGAFDDKIAVNRKVVETAAELAVSMLAGGNRFVELGAVASLRKATCSPALMGDMAVAHFSLPAFDSGEMPEISNPVEIKSAKFEVEKPSVLISKLNPRFPRVWNLARLPAERAFASTEFLVLEPMSCSTSVLWALLRSPVLSAQLQSQVAGTSGSHQRVKPADVMASQVPDPEQFSPSLLDTVSSLGTLVVDRREESASLVRLRDTLLPRLIAGELRVRDAEREVESVL
ncbi:hypothetical protein G4H71_15310 [Rhodococcus triatomae]|uniref:Type I restriction enzyme, S subunit n=1 Tax=Rhodococcus triatomae TaxID=300028 RepID=A0A1G8IYL9_9NOCA|nr:restriction endonuclease subunit S [Rhodococcus triatomae]QNG19867.1 hypothetical protein G4H72_15060 [Rhodococcus triatomae]QNG24217.1 hypothetical protein G4H71_15310 [Rhodococcus triatomae]SDI24039.1 type I restriction enzyme, S subunit [Rhodococcus triatomae]